MNAIAQAEQQAAELIIITSIIGILYLAYRYRRTIKGAVKVYEATEEVITQAAQPIIVPVNIVSDIITNDLSTAKYNYIEYEGGPDANGWLDMFGADVYNDGFGSFNYRSLAENAENLAHRHGNLIKYLKTVDATLLMRGNRLSPFQTRQNLTILPFSGEMHGFFGSSVASLKEAIWTDWDRLPEWVRQWNNNQLSRAGKIRIKNMHDKDIKLIESYQEIKHFQTWIVNDRVRAWKEILEANNIDINNIP